jgi:hypothetical protein
MPVAKIHVLEGRYDEARLGKVSAAVQDALVAALSIPSEDFFQIIDVLPQGSRDCARGFPNRPIRSAADQTLTRTAATSADAGRDRALAGQPSTRRPGNDQFTQYSPDAIH